MQRHRLLFTLIFSCVSITLSAKKTPPPQVRVDPPNWWVGMETNNIELLFSGSHIQDYQIALEHPSCKISKVTKAKNPDYLYVELTIEKNCQAGNLTFFLINKKGKKFPIAYTLKSREKQPAKGIDASDLIYLVFPDRFANGDASNDSFSWMHEKTMDRSGPKSRHGGDLKGIRDHLDYISEIGTTAMWINPVIENNQDYESYHGYAATDLYKIDPRFGDNELYKSLVTDCHNKQIKVIWDVVYNHWGNKNWLFQNLPDSNWVHWFNDFTRTNYRAEVLLDPYASDSDKNRMTNAWFDKHMPDLNQQDEHLSKYLIQNSIWWIEYAGIDAFRIDTYAYPDQQFMKHLNESIRKEYPDFVLFGETWVQGTPVQAWYTENCYLKKNYSSSLQGVTDFQLYYAITKGLNEKTGWEEGFSRIELTLSHDILYSDPTHLVTFLDNHDLSRYYSVVGEDFNKYKMGIALMYTLRGIPSIYYGTEILMKNFADPDAKVREDFVGGWKDDTMNKFNSSGRNAQENAAFEFCSALGNWRRMNKWIATAKLKQFVPEHNTYVYFRYDDSHMLMCLYNDSENEKEVEMGRYAECLKNKSSATNILTQQKELLNQNIKIPVKGFKLLMLE